MDSNAALATLQQQQQQAQDPNAILNAQRQQLGVQGAQDTVTGLRGAINNTTKLLQQVAPSVMGRTGSSLVTNAQATKQISNEQAPISQNLSDQSTQYNQADEDLNKLQDEATTQANGIYQGQEDKLSYAQNLYNTLYQKEKDAQDAAESKREFDADLAQKTAASASLNPVLGGGVTPAPKATTPTANNDAKTLTGGKSVNDAATALKQLLSTKNGSTITSTISAIEKSAQYGNTYDQAKLQFIKSQPEFQQYLVNYNNASF